LTRAKKKKLDLFFILGTISLQHALDRLLPFLFLWRAASLFPASTSHFSSRQNEDEPKREQANKRTKGRNSPLMTW
jgi:hypothetical protein